MRGKKQIIYDLTPNMEIKLSDGRVVALAELETMVANETFYGYAPWSASTQPRSTRILIGISADGLFLFDFKTRISHRWASRKPAEIDLREMGKLLEELKGHGQ